MCVRQAESLLEARASHTDCIRGEKSAISTALTSVIGYADPPGDGPPHQITSMTLSIYLFDPRRVFILNTTKVKVTKVNLPSSIIFNKEAESTRAHLFSEDVDVVHVNTYVRS